MGSLCIDCWTYLEHRIKYHWTFFSFFRFTGRTTFVQPPVMQLSTVCVTLHDSVPWPPTARNMICMTPTLKLLPITTRSLDISVHWIWPLSVHCMRVVKRKSCTLLLMTPSLFRQSLFTGFTWASLHILEISVHWICTHALARFACSYTHPEASMQVLKGGAYTRTDDPSHGFELEIFFLDLGDAQS